MKGLLLAMGCGILATFNILNGNEYLMTIPLCLTYSVCEIMQHMYGKELEEDVW